MSCKIKIRVPGGNETYLGPFQTDRQSLADHICEVIQEGKSIVLSANNGTVVLGHRLLSQNIIYIEEEK